MDKLKQFDTHTRAGQARAPHSSRSQTHIEWPWAPWMTKKKMRTNITTLSETGRIFTLHPKKKFKANEEDGKRKKRRRSC